jgi:2-polyprenyl-3-methyl-5-hydroxy-6-metoxy-1,4-benzoquinol methylase
MAFIEIPVLRCNQCSFLYSGHVMAPEAMKLYYKDTFGSNKHLLGQRINAKVNLALLENLLDLRNIKSFLDVGTGYGFLIKALKERHGIQAKGVEMSQQEAEYAIKTLKIEVRSGLLSESGLPKESFDVVASFEVIEHITNPVQFVAELTQYVKPGGVLLVMTDNFTSAVVRKMGAEFPKWIPHSHISHFDPKTLTRCIESVPGLKVEKRLSYTPWELVAHSVVMMSRKPKPPEEVYSMEADLNTEMSGTYKFFPLRLALNSLWAGMTFRRDLEGALMYVLSRKG